MESSLLRGNCSVCRQRGVLGIELVHLHNEFRCCACVDEHGVDLIAPSVIRKTGADEAAANWWAHLEPPPRLEDVPAGMLKFTELSFVTGGRAEKIVLVTDPDFNYFSGHGGRCIWPAASTLARYLLQMPATGLKVVELGAGTGLPGLLTARSCNRVVLTDVPWVLQLTEYNVQANYVDEDSRRPRVMSLRWGSQSDVEAVFALLDGAPDLVIAADVLYRHQDFDSFLQTLAALRAHEVLITAAERSNIVPDFLSRLPTQGWIAQVSPPCREPGAGAASDSQVRLLRLHRPALQAAATQAVPVQTPLAASPRARCRATPEKPPGAARSARLATARLGGGRRRVHKNVVGSLRGGGAPSAAAGA
mmetsp:Transcript_41982/g.121719  ORF Transcript_41982/g.121719 Transcript_41982/m.121719 type:complete len:363 (+) Transcript_41982:74-1162(+)